MHASAGTGRRRLALALSATAVAGFGILPVAAAATVVTAPSAGDVTLVSGAEGIRSHWFVENSGGAGDGTPDGAECDGHPGLAVTDAAYDPSDRDRGDAFDKGLVFFVGGEQLVAPESWDLDIDDEGLTRAVTAGPVLAAHGLQATVEYRAMPSQQVLRSLVRLTNDTDEPVSTTFTLATNAGSDDATLLLGSSSGDAELTDADRWLVTGDNALLPSDPVVTHVLAGPGEIVSAPRDLVSRVFDCAGTEGVAATFDVSIEPGAAQTLVFFDELSADPVLAVQDAARFGEAPDLEGELFAGLSAEDLAAVSNWTFEEQDPEPAPAPAPAPRDSVAPESTATAPAVSTSSTWPVSFEARDVGDGVGSVELYVKRPGAADYTSVGRISGRQAGSFEFDAAGVEGSYSFYTVATDLAGNLEPAPATADTTTVVDRSGPSSSATSPSQARRTTFPVHYDLASDAGSDATAVSLFVRKPGASRYVVADRDVTGALDGVFDYTGKREGRYRFYTVATDAAGNTEAAPTRPDTHTRVDLTAPVVESRLDGAPALVDLGTHTRTILRMWVSERGTTSFVVRRDGRKVAEVGPEDTERGLVAGTWDRRDGEGDRVAPGRYVLVLKAVDRAGNRTAVRTPMRLVR